VGSTCQREKGEGKWKQAAWGSLAGEEELGCVEERRKEASGLGHAGRERRRVGRLGLGRKKKKREEEWVGPN
jgi:hypothetical protein